MRLAPHSRIRLAGAAVITGLAVGTVAATAAPASADTVVHAKYQVTGSVTRARD